MGNLPWQHLYDTGFWKRRRAQQLRAEPLCAFCEERGVTTPATVADHVEAHRGDPNLFYLGALQSLCESCHNSRKKYVEIRGYKLDVDADGWPVDARHPANREKYFRYGVPHGLRPSAIPVTLVCGPPAAGKTTWIKQRAARGDTVIDLDDCKVAVGGRRWDEDFDVRFRALRYRDQMLFGLAERERGHAYVVVGAPTLAERKEWCNALGAAEVVVLNVPAETCIERIKADPKRSHAERDLIGAVNRWHQRNRL